MSTTRRGFLSRFYWYRKWVGGEWCKKREEWHHTVSGIPFKEIYVMPSLEDITFGMDDDQKRRFNKMWGELPEHERMRIQSEWALIWWFS